MLIRCISVCFRIKNIICVSKRNYCGIDYVLVYCLLIIPSTKNDYKYVFSESTYVQWNSMEASNMNAEIHGTYPKKSALLLNLNHPTVQWLATN